MPGDPQAFASVEVYYLLASDEVDLDFPQVLGGALWGAFPGPPWAWEHQGASRVVGWDYREVDLAGQDEVASAL